jgi:predicted Ser/Thr protein kinase
MNKILLKNAQLFLSILGYRKIKSIKEIKDGRNSQVYKIKVDQCNLVLKVYGDKKKLRIKREKIFYEYLNKIEKNYTVNPLGFNIDMNMALYPYINGNKIKKIRNSYIKNLVNFINQINKKKKLYQVTICDRWN